MADLAQDTDEPGDAAAEVQALRESGAHRGDPARFHYLETLAARAARAQGPLRTLLQRRLRDALRAFEAGAKPPIEEALQAARQRGRGAATGELGALLRQLDGRGALPAAAGAAPPAPAELKALHRARGTWARLRVEQQLHRALATVPRNPGPLNSHLLVLRALQRLQALSPAYLERFVVHAETLAWLQGAQAAAPVAPRARGATSRYPAAGGR